MNSETTCNVSVSRSERLPLRRLPTQRRAVPRRAIATGLRSGEADDVSPWSAVTTELQEAHTPKTAPETKRTFCIVFCATGPKYAFRACPAEPGEAERLC